MTAKSPRRLLPQFLDTEPAEATPTTTPPTTPPTHKPRRRVVHVKQIVIDRTTLMEAVEGIASRMDLTPAGAPVVPPRAWLLVSGVANA